MPNLILDWSIIGEVYIYRKTMLKQLNGLGALLNRVSQEHKIIWE